MSSTSAYLTFGLGEEKFAIKVDHVQEVVEFGQVTKVPHAPAYMLGVINLRGRVLPLLDTRLKLGLPKAELTSKSRIMVLDIQGADDKSVQVGAMVDVAREVLELGERDIQETPGSENLSGNNPITGIVNNQGDITMVMDIRRVFAVSEIVELNRSLN